MSHLIKVNDFGFNLDSVICWYRSPERDGNSLILNLQGDHILKFTGKDADLVQHILSHSALNLPAKIRTEKQETKWEVA